MKKILAFFAIILFAVTVSAQAPNKLSYQAVIRNSSNDLVTNQVVGMRITILQNSPTGTPVYAETQTPTTNTNGLASVEIGGGAIVWGNFSTIDWADGPYFVKTETDPAGGTSYSITGISQLMSVPYALYASTAGRLEGVDTTIRYVGEHYGGGVIFYLWKDSEGVEHGLIVAPKAMDNSSDWSNVSAMIGASAQSSWDGFSNCNAIVGQGGHTSSAAKTCLDWVNGGYNDWYLPSIDELILLWHNRFIVNKTLSTIFLATELPLTGNYWSSTESNADYAWYFAFGVGNVTNYYKSSPLRVRAIRAF